MRRFSIFLAAIALVSFTASIALAQCAFDAPSKAKGMKTDMVRAMVTCGGITFPTPTTLTNAGVPACSPVTPYSAYVFTPADPLAKNKGKCSVKTKTKFESPCSDGSVDPITLLPQDCSNTSLQAKCGGVLNSDGATPVDGLTGGQGWALKTVARVTFDDKASGDMTIIDFPAQFNLPDAKKGKLKGKFDTNTLLNELFGDGSALPGCTMLELKSIAIADPDGNNFAVVGSSSRPK